MCVCVCPGSPSVFLPGHTISHSVSFVAVVHPRSPQGTHTKIPVQYAAVNSTSRKNHGKSIKNQTGEYGELRVLGSQSYNIILTKRVLEYRVSRDAQPALSHFLLSLISHIKYSG